MKNYIQPGNNITVAAPTAVTSGAGVILGDLFGVANGDAVSGADVVLSTVGVFELPKTTADDIPAGSTVFWDASESEVTLTSTDNTKIGVAIAAVGAGTVIAKVRLNGSF